MSGRPLKVNLKNRGPSKIFRGRPYSGWLLKPGTGRNDRGTFRPVPPTKIRNCVRMEFNSNHQELTSLHLEVDKHADLIMQERS